MMRQWTIAAIVATTLWHADGFSVSQMQSRRSVNRLRPLSYSFFDHDGDSPAEELLRARTCVRNLLTQRAIQSFMFLLNSVRDPHTVDWLQSNLQADNLEHYHGTGAFNMTHFPNWDSVLLEMLAKPKETVVAARTTRRGAGGGGWRGQIGGFNTAGQPPAPPGKKPAQNPHVQESVIEYEIEMDPVSLVSRIISVREQIAKECTKDLDTLIYANNQILSSYFETQENYRGEHAEQEEATTDKNTDNNASSDVEADEDMESLTIPYSDASRDGAGDHRHVFDRFNAMLMLSNSMSVEFDSGNGVKSSPLRTSNFDLMLLLSTQESIHRVLREYAQSGDEREVSFTWLQEFYLKRVHEFFDGNQPYGRADDFLEELLSTSPMLKSWDSTSSRKEMVGLVDPLRMAEDIIRMRGEVGEEWKEIVANVPRDHMELRKALLSRQMGEQIDFSDLAASDKTEGNEGFE